MFCLQVCQGSRYMPGAHKSKKASDSWGLDRLTDSCKQWELEIKLEFSERAASTLNDWAISSVPLPMLLIILLKYYSRSREIWGKDTSRTWIKQLRHMVCMYHFKKILCLGIQTPIKYQDRLFNYIYKFATEFLVTENLLSCRCPFPLEDVPQQLGELYKPLAL